ncbi:MAG: hypothetical protein AMXMBFR58_05970 [Phycisphaerae bacterium]|nr:hypothetical protein [Phycisphaerales bacterium]
MSCLLAAFALLLPRTVILILVIFSDYIGRAWQNDLWPFLGFFFMPYTTLAYSWAMNSAGKVDGIQLVIVIIAALLDVGSITGGEQVVRKRRARAES